jgi:diacylglycerol kinase (ATP)
VKIALIHNPDAFRGEVDGRALRRLFERAGHEVTYASTKEPDWQGAISPQIERAVIVGGDGTVQLVAPYLRHTPFSIVPFGTANNIADCLRQTRDTEVLASQLHQTEISSLDLGRTMIRGESKPFLEAAGMGVFVDLILELNNRPKIKELRRAESRTQKFACALDHLLTMSRSYNAIDWELKADDTVVRDRFVLIAVMNVELIGPKLRLAPNADPEDGYLDLVCVRERDRESFSRWLQEQLPGHKTAGNFERRRCRRVEATAATIAPVHVDSDLIKTPQFPLVIEVEPAALKYASLV